MSTRTISERARAVVLLLLAACAGGDDGAGAATGGGGPCPVVGMNSKMLAGQGVGVDPCGSSLPEACESVGGKVVADCMGSPGVTTGGVWSAACRCDACGNGMHEVGEECDALDFSGTTCANMLGQGAGGSLQCTADCKINWTMCTAAPTTTAGTGG